MICLLVDSTQFMYISSDKGIQLHLYIAETNQSFIKVIRYYVFKMLLTIRNTFKRHSLTL